MHSSLQHRIRAQTRDIGGLSVGRLLPAALARSLGPFVFLDHMGPVSFQPGQGVDVGPHPHIGLATLTYLFEGQLMHRDSGGHEQLILPGDVNWMVAGQGIVHSERTPASERQRGARLHGLQTWLALPLANEETKPAFYHHPASTLPKIELPQASLHVVAGEAYGQRSPVEVFSGTLYVAARLNQGAALRIPTEHEERGIYLVSGRISLDDEPVDAGELVTLAPGIPGNVRATTNSLLMLLGGEKLDAPRRMWWNFVASDVAMIEAAKERWERDEFPPVPGETGRVPLPAQRIVQE